MDKIIIEDFKIFKGEHIFDLDKLNVFTGVNNVGKSTFINIVSLFAKGLEKGDFPSIDLFETKAGNFNNLVNWDSGAKSFKIGFFIKLGKAKVPFKIIYEFVNGDSTKYNLENERGNAVFSNFEVFDEKGNFFFGAYASSFFEINKENIEYDFDWDSKDKPETPFKCALAGSNPPLLFLKLDIKYLEEHLSIFSFKKYKLLFDRVKTVHKHNNWWIGRFLEEDFYYLGLSVLKLRDLIIDFKEDEFLELMDYDEKKVIFFGSNEIERKKILREYKSLLKKTKYEDFLNEIIEPLILSIDKGLEQFRTKNFVHVTYRDFKDRLFMNDAQNHDLIRLYHMDTDDLAKFSREALNIFGIDGFIELDSINNQAIEVNIVRDLKKTDDKLKL